MVAFFAFPGLFGTPGGSKNRRKSTPPKGSKISEGEPLGAPEPFVTDFNVFLGFERFLVDFSCFPVYVFHVFSVFFARFFAAFH